MKKIFTLISLCIITSNVIGQGTWTQRMTCPGSQRYRAVAFEVNGKCYMGTGSTGGGISQNLKDLWEYDVVGNTWAQKTDLPGAKRTNATAASFGIYGYVGLGSNNGTLLNDWWQFDPAGNSWLQKSSFPGVPRFGAGSFTIQSRIYTGGGMDSTNNSRTDFYSYDPANDIWAQKSPLLTGVTSMAIFVLGNNAYFVAGLTNGVTNSSVKVTQEYNSVGDSWSTKAEYPHGNSFSSIGFGVAGYGYVGTGITGMITDVMYRYDPIGDDWSSETSWPTGIRQWAVSCVSGNRVFAGTGNATGGQLYNDWYEFIPLFTGNNNTSDKSVFSVSFNQSLHEMNIYAPTKKWFR